MVQKKLGFRILFIALFFFISLFGKPVLGTSVPFWLKDTASDNTDVHVAFRGHFSIDKESEVSIHISGASVYMMSLDGKFLLDGPDRFIPGHPTVQELKISLKPGEHLISIQVHSEGVTTRMLQKMDPFLYYKIFENDRELKVDWRCQVLPGYLKQFKRVSPQLGWLEWVDTRLNQENWKMIGFDDSGWEIPAPVSHSPGEFKSSDIALVKNVPTEYEKIAEGPVANFFGYEKDDPSARFFLRDLECKEIPPQGIWRRYDLGRIKLTRPRFILDLPEGAVVEFAFSEYLRHDRVMPWINLSLDDTYNLAHFVARGGVQEFMPFSPKGGRFVEMHIIAPPEKIKIIDEQFIERRYYDEPEGSFVCNDEELNQVWNLGLNTYMSCAEDALVDNPTRERGQWMGDAVVGLKIGASGFSDLKIIKKGLYQHAQCAREDGMVAGLSPGNLTYLSTFSALWVNACIDYYKTTGDISVLEELFPYAEKNIQAFESNKLSDGISNEAGWAFVDWGYVRNEGKSDMGLNLIYYGALQDMIRWSELLSDTKKADYYRQLKDEMKTIIEKWFEPFLTSENIDWKMIGYHRTALGMKYGLIPGHLFPEAVNYLKSHILSCFPNNPDAPRLSDPGANNPQLITPYFANYAFPLLIENGETEFVLDQYKKCWGWMLEQNITTCLEVFDIRWSHCHGWSGSPTWQLSKYFLGFHQNFSSTNKEFILKLYTGNLMHASGKIPVEGNECINVEWEKKGEKLVYTIDSPIKISLIVPEAKKYGIKKSYVVEGRLALELKNVN